MAVLALLLGFTGHLIDNFEKVDRSELTTSQTIKIVLESVPPTLRVFRPRVGSDPGSKNWPLTIGNTLGSIVTLAAIIALLWAVLKEQVEKFRISNLRNHIILLGFDQKSKLFLKSKSRPKDTSVVVLDTQASEKIRKKVHAAECLHYAGSSEIDVTKQLEDCRVKHAEKLIISTGSDTENLELHREIFESGLFNQNGPNEIRLVVDDLGLHRQLEQSDPFMQSLGANTDIRLFNYSKSAASYFLSRTNFSKLAQEMEQSKISLLVFGHSLHAIEFVAQFLRLSPTHGFGKPEINWIVGDSHKLEKLLSRHYPPLAVLTKSSSHRFTIDENAPLKWAADVSVREREPNAECSDETFLKEVTASTSDLTSIIVAEEEIEGEITNIELALELKNASLRLDKLFVPTFVFSERKSALDQFMRRSEDDGGMAPEWLKRIAPAPTQKEVLEPFGRSDEVCNWTDQDTQRELLAKQIHEKYLIKRAVEKDQEFERIRSNKPWHLLSETYKNANRIAADHFSMLTFSNYLLENHSLEDKIEALAELEHNAWWIDRELDGWRVAENRENDRKYHPNLVPYSELSDKIKEYDRAHVRNLLGELL